MAVLRADYVKDRAQDNVSFVEGMAVGNQMAKTILDHRNFQEQMDLEKEQFKFYKDQKVLENLFAGLDRVAETHKHGYRGAFEALGPALKSHMAGNMGVDPAAVDKFLHEASTMDLNFKTMIGSLAHDWTMIGPDAFSGQMTENLFNDKYINIGATGSPSGKIEDTTTIKDVDLSEAEYKREPQITDDMFTKKPEDAEVATGRPTSRSSAAQMVSPTGGEQENITSQGSFALQQVQPTQEDKEKASWVGRSSKWEGPELGQVDMEKALLNLKALTGREAKSASDLADAYLLEAHPEGDPYWNDNPAGAKKRKLSKEEGTPEKYFEDHQRIKEEIIKQNPDLFTKDGTLRQKGDVIKETFAEFSNHKLTVSKTTSRELGSDKIFNRVAEAYGVPEDLRDTWLQTVKEINNVEDLGSIKGKTLRLPSGPEDFSVTQVQTKGKPYQTKYIYDKIDKITKYYDATEAYKEHGRVPSWTERLDEIDKRKSQLSSSTAKEKSQLATMFKEMNKVLDFSQKASKQYTSAPTEDIYDFQGRPYELMNTVFRAAGVYPMDQQTFMNQVQQAAAQSGQPISPEAASQAYAQHLQQKYQEAGNVLVGMNAGDLSSSAVKNNLSSAEYYKAKAIGSREETKQKIAIFNQMGGGQGSGPMEFTDENILGLAQWMLADEPAKAVDLLSKWVEHKSDARQAQWESNPQWINSYAGKAYQDARAIVDTYMQEHGTSGGLFSSDFYTKLKKNKLPEHVVQAWHEVVKHLSESFPDEWDALPTETKDGSMILMLERADISQGESEQSEEQRFQQGLQYLEQFGSQ